MAEDDDLVARLGEYLLQQAHDFIGFSAEVGDAVEQIRAVAGHAHQLQMHGQGALIAVG